MRRSLLILVLVMFCGLPLTASAADPQPGEACADEDAVQRNGGAETNGVGHTLVCDGGTWKGVFSFDGAGQVTQIGDQTCNNNEILQFDGSKWGCGTASGLPSCPDGDTIVTEAGGWICSSDDTPDAFSFTDLTDVATSALTTSNTLQITGLVSGQPTSISGTGSPEYRICSDSGCSSEVQTWTTGAATIHNNEYLQLRLTSSSSDLTMRSATMSIGSDSDQWDVTTNDNAPDAFSFTDQTDVATSTLLTSDIVQITGITGNVPVSITGDGSPEYRTCSDSGCSTEVQTWTSGAASIQNNEYLQLRLTSNAATSTTNSATVTVGSDNDQWDVTTRTAVTATFIGDASSATDSTQYTFSGQSIGTPQADRLVVVIAGGLRSAERSDIVNFTIDGSPATIAVATDGYVAIGYRKIPTGTTADISIEFELEVVRAAISIYTITGQQNDTPYDTVIYDNDAANVSASVDVDSHGSVIAGYYNSDAQATTWTGLTENNDFTIESDAASTASDYFSSAQTVNFTTNHPDYSAAASWR